MIGGNSKYVYDAASGYGDIYEDVRIASIVESSIAEQLGLLADDIIRSIRIDGKEYPLRRYFDISDALLYARESSTLSIVYERESVSAETQGYSVQKSDLNTIA